MKKSFIAAGAFLTSFFVFSSFAYAQSGATVANASASLGGIAGIINTFTQTIVKATGGLLMAAAMVAFFYGLVQYIWGARQGDPKKISDGNTFIKWSLVALFVMFSVYGIIKWTQSTLCPTCDFTTISIPDLNFKSGGTNNNGGQGLPLPQNNGGGPGLPLVGGSPGTMGATCASNAGCTGSLVCSNGVCAVPGGQVGSGPVSNVGCARANGGTCSVNGAIGTCQDYVCVPSGSSGPVGNVSCTRANGGTCSVNGTMGTCVDWTCDTTSSGN